MPTPSQHHDAVRSRCLVVSDSGLERHRLRRALHRGGLQVTGAVDPWAAEGELARDPGDVTVWAAPRSQGLARALIAAGRPAPPVLLVLEGGASATAAAAALGAGFADVVREGAGGELVARARAVAARTRAERALASEAAAFRELAEGGRDLLARHGPEGLIRYASGAAREVLGWDPRDLVGRRAAEFLPPADESEAPRLHRVRRRDGRSVWLETTTRLLPDGTGRVREVHTDSRDVSERVRAEEEREAVSRVTAGVAEGLDAARVCALVAGEVLRLAVAESAAVARVRGDEAVVVGAAGAGLRPGERIPLEPAGPAEATAAIAVDGAPWGLILARGIAADRHGSAAGERLARLAPLVGLAVSNARARERLVALATTDPLTGLANHRAFHDRLGEECARADRSGDALTLVAIDLDHFKRVNDTHGHGVGDDVLREVARRLTDCGRLGDVVARVGGEELAWLLPATGLQDGLRAAERLRRRIGDEPFAVVGRLTASLGVAALAGGGPVELARRADLALYRAKEGGRDACVAWGDSAPVTAALSG